MSEHRVYRNPPIEEALCEFHFKPRQDWDLTIPGKFHVELGDGYGGKPQEQRVVGIALNQQGEQPANLNLNEGLARVQLLNEDGNRMVAIGQNVLSVHMLRPYHDPNREDGGGWQEFKARINEALGAYWNVVRPEGVIRVGVRYINKIVLPQSAAKVESYLNCALPVVAGFPSRLSNYMSRVEYVYDDEVRLVLSQGTTRDPQDPMRLLLDLDVIWQSSDIVTLQSALEKAEMLRMREQAAFEAAITDSSRELFDEC